MSSPSAAPDFDEVMRSRAAGVEGWMSPDQARRLWDAALRCPAGGSIVEIGSFRGRSTVVLASAAPEGTTVVAIDPHAGNDRGPQEFEGFGEASATDFEVFHANLAAAGVSDRVRHVRAFSHAAHGEVEGEIDVLYIDGAHRYRPAHRDIVEWSVRVRPGGTMLIHDSFSSIGVTLAILQELVPSSTFRYVGRSRSLTEYRREPVGAVGARLANAGRQLAQLPWFVRSLALKVALLGGLGKLLAKVGRPVPEWPY